VLRLAGEGEGHHGRGHLGSAPYRVGALQRLVDAESREIQRALGDPPAGPRVGTLQEKLRLFPENVMS
jgi:hypothetical protein